MKSLSLQAINESSSYEVSVVYDGCYQFSRCVVRETPEVVTKVEREEDVAETTAGIENEETKNISYVYVGFTDGMKIEHHKLSYNELVSFIQKIRPLCLV